MIKASELLQALNWRYATKVFDGTKTIGSGDWKVLEEALVLSPSSYGLQPWKFLVVRDPNLREQLMEHSWKQRQVVDCSHFVVFLGRTDINEADIDRWILRMAEVQQSTVESLQFYKKMMIGDLVNGPRHAWIVEWVARQVYIALGNFMTSAALIGVDTCPMEGIDPSKYDEILKLGGTGYKTMVACAAGYRSSTDKYSQAPKIRYEIGDLVQKI